MYAILNNSAYVHTYAYILQTRLCVFARVCSLYLGYIMVLYLTSIRGTACYTEVLVAVLCLRRVQEDRIGACYATFLWRSCC